jgi:DNA-binding LacI/PurR family transcriptional regulator
VPRVTIKEIAKKAGLSNPTVSRILNNKAGFQIKKEKRELVLELSKKMGYQPDYAARSLRSGKRFAVGVAGGGSLNDLRDIAAGQWYAGIGKVVEKYGYYLSFFPIAEDFNESLVQMARQKMVDGLIVINYSPHYESFVKQVVPLLHEEHLPLVVIHSNSAPYDCHNVGLDVEKGGVMAAEHLISQGYKNIMTAGFHDSRFGNEFRQGVQKAAEQPGLHIADFPARGRLVSARIGYELGQAVLKSGKPADAYLLAHDFLAMGFMEALKEKGIGVPDDAGVMGFGDILKTEQVMIPFLTTIDRHLDCMGQKAAELLFDILEGRLPVDSGWKTEILQPELVVRKTTRKQ